MVAHVHCLNEIIKFMSKIKSLDFSHKLILNT